MAMLGDNQEVDQLRIMVRELTKELENVRNRNKLIRDGLEAAQAHAEKIECACSLCLMVRACLLLPKL